MNEIADNYWYRQPMIWFIIGLLATTMLASFAMLFVATQNAPDLVVASYANIDELTDKTREQDQLAVDLGLSAVISVDENEQLIVELSSSNEIALPTMLIVRTQNSTRADLDSRAELQGSAGIYTGNIALPANGYDLHIEDPAGTWRLSKRLFATPSRTELTPFNPGQ